MHNKYNYFSLLFVLSCFFVSMTARADLPTTKETEPNNAFGTATTILTSTAVMHGSISPNADIDFYSFNAIAGDRIYAAIMSGSSSSGNSDSVIDVIDTDGSSVIETDNDDGTFSSLSSSIAGTVIPTSGTYYLKIYNFNPANQIRPYKLFFQQRAGSPVAEVEPNDVAGPGSVVPPAGWISGSTSSDADIDYYQLSLNAGDTVYLSLDLDPERDTTEWNGILGLGNFGTSPVVLTANDAGSSTPDSEAFFTTVKDTGTYVVYVAASSTFGTYNLNVSIIPSQEATSNCTTYTSTDVPQVIPAGPGSVSSTITIPGSPRIADMNVAIQLNHNFMTDLDVHLTSPSGNDNALFTDVGSGSAGVQSDMDIILDDESALPIDSFQTLSSTNRALHNQILQPELSYRLSWYDRENAGGLWTLTLRDDATPDGGTLTGWSIKVCEPEPQATCPSGTEQTIIYSSDFESNDGGFTHSGTGDEWELGLPSFAPITGCNNGSSCWKTDLDNTYEANSSQDLLSPAIDLSGYSAPVYINWAQKYQMESATFDHMYVDAQQFGGATPVRLFEWDGATMTSSVGNPLSTIAASAGWGNFSERVDSLAGLNSEIRFHIDSDTVVQHAGLAVDDVSVTACRTLYADLSLIKTDGVTEVNAGNSVTYTIVAFNAGPDSAPSSSFTDNFPASCSSVSWTCLAAGGATCTASGSGNISDTVSLPVGGTITYTATCTVSPSASGSLSNTAVLSNSVINDPTPGNNSATDTDTINALTPTPTATVTPIVSPTTNTPDLCPSDTAKTAPGVCGCGVSDTDANANGQADCLDPASGFVPTSPNAKTSAKGGFTLTSQTISGVTQYEFKLTYKVNNKKKTKTYKSATPQIKKRLSNVRKGTVVSYQMRLRIGTQVTAYSRAKKFKVR